jgi:hypothetical protein
MFGVGAVQTEGPGRETIEVQVKSIRWMDVRGRWQLGVKSQQPALSQHEWDALVMLDPDAPTAAPRTFIVPRDHVAAAAWMGHMNWLTDPHAPPGKRNAGLDQARVGIETVQRYEDCWDLLGTPTDKIARNAPGLVPRTRRRPESRPAVGAPVEERIAGMVVCGPIAAIQ